MNISLEKAVQIGLQLRPLINTESFQTAVEALREEYRTRVFDSDYSEREKREQAYQQHRALDDLLINLNTFVNIAEAETLGEFTHED
ncbi:MAG: hypothetical protein IE937_01120 [Gammaproteobacteria bacterium]|nr:hypothetical protein [Gammaproteobacteria bacterium]